MSDWQPIESAPTELFTGKCEKFLVTNNRKARTAHGHMSHVWLVSMIHEKDGEVCAFSDGSYNRVYGITHFMPLGVTAAADRLEGARTS